MNRSQSSSTIVTLLPFQNFLFQPLHSPNMFTSLNFSLFHERRKRSKKVSVSMLRLGTEQNRTKSNNLRVEKKARPLSNAISVVFIVDSNIMNSALGSFIYSRTYLTECENVQCGHCPSPLNFMLSQNMPNSSK